MKKALKKILAAIAITTISITSLFSASAAAKDNVTLPSEVTYEMASPSYWKNISNNDDEIIMTASEIKSFNNKLIANSEKTKVRKIDSLESASYGGFSKYESDLYINGKKINQDDYINSFKAEHKKYKNMKYAVAVKRTVMKSWPILSPLGFSADDCDDEAAISALVVNEPIVIGGKTIVNNHLFYYATSGTCEGWVDSQDVALFSDKEAWLDAWKVKLTGKNFLVVTEDKIYLDESNTNKSVSSLELTLGTVLKLVPNSKLPENLNERGTWFNHVVYVPTRKSNGKCEMVMALIPMKYKVSIGYLPLTENNLLDVSFTLLGKNFGWGGSLGSYDCSLFHKIIMNCFGINFPRTGNLEVVPEKFSDVSNMDDAQKIEYIKALNVGSILYFKGFSMMYVGTINDTPYVLCSNGFLSDSKGEVKVRNVYSVVLVPLTVRRGNGNTWLTEVYGIFSL